MLHQVLAQLLGDDYVTVPAVPLLDEHVLTDRTGQTEAVIDAAFLNVVAANNNARVERTGDATPLVIGHTRDGAPETEQPPLVGYATNFRVGDFDASGRQALFADFHVRRDRGDVLRDYPRRSVELWVKKQEIDPISLLGATTPERDLGILKYSRRDDTAFSLPSPGLPMTDAKTKPKPKRYAADDEPKGDAAKPQPQPKPPEPPKPDDVAAAEKGETSDSREISTKLDKLLALIAPIAEMLGEAMKGDDADEQPKGDDTDAAAADDDAPADDDASGGESADEADADDDLLGPADPADAESEKDAAEFHDTPVRFGQYDLPRVAKMNRDKDDVVKLQRQHDALAKQHADLLLKYSRLDADKKVAELERDGYQFADRDEDVETLARLSTDAAKKHFVEKIKKNYKRDAVASTGDLARYSREQVGEPAATMADVQAAISKGQFKSAADAYEHFGKKAK